MKTCNKCKQIKKINDFYANKKLKDGHHNECKECNNIYRRKYFQENKEKRNKGSKLNIIKWKKEEYIKDKKKCLTRSKTQYLIKIGKIIKPNKCELCDDTLVQAHHFNYNSPYYVYWVCKKHHQYIHNLERKMRS